MLRKIIVAVCCMLSVTANAQIIDTLKKDLLTAPDTVKRLHSKEAALIVPGVLVVYGISSFVIHPVRRVDFFFRSEIAKTDPNFHSKAENFFAVSPIIFVYGLDLAGIEGKNRFIDRTALLGLSGGILGLTSYTLKYTTHRLRPNGQDYLSFPSGHTSLAFMGAEFMAQEYSEKSPAYTVIGYTFAVTTGIFRMYNRDHWFSDVVAGAGFGVLSTKLAYLVYPYVRNKLTHRDKKGRSTFIMPTYQSGMPGLSFAMEL